MFTGQDLFSVPSRAGVCLRVRVFVRSCVCVFYLWASVCLCMFVFLFVLVFIFGCVSVNCVSVYVGFCFLYVRVCLFQECL